MPSIVRTTSPQKLHVPASKKKFRTVLGFGQLSRNSSDTESPTTPTSTLGRNTFTRKSIDTARSYANRRKHKADRSNVTAISFFQQESEPTEPQIIDTPPPIVNLAANDMTVDGHHSQTSSRRPPVRMDAQDGPWSISVAETPLDARSYSLYIKSKFLPLISASFCLSGNQLNDIRLVVCCYACLE